MADLIDRAALKDYISSLWDMQDAYLPCHFFDAMDDMPTVDAEPVRHAHWIEDEYGYMRCSECKFEHDSPEYVTQFCPMCGAKMDEIKQRKKERKKNGRK